MLDIKFIRENKKIVQDSCQKRGVSCDLDKLLRVDQKKRLAQTKFEAIAAKKNKAGKEIARVSASEKKKIISEMKKIDKEGDRLKGQLAELEDELTGLLWAVPNLLAADVPTGKDENSNKVIAKVGQPPKFNFKIKDHLELGEILGILDTKKASQIAGTRFHYLMGPLAILEFALIRYAFDVLSDKKILTKLAKKHGVSDKPFIPVIPPMMIKPEVFSKMARLSEDDRNERYHLTQDDLYLVGSAEHTLGPLHMDEIIEEKDLPIRYVGFSASFRREAGSYGKDTRGILRVHQFDKVEIESFTTGEKAISEQNFIIALQEYLVSSLDLPYQKVIICSGDMGNPDYRQIDLECWIPSQDKYRETHTSDLMGDYQARRLNARIKRKTGIEYAQMNDATVFAMSRMPIAILENFQQKDGSVKIPKVLHKYTGFKSMEPKLS